MWSRVQGTLITSNIQTFWCRYCGNANTSPPQPPPPKIFYWSFTYTRSLLENGFPGSTAFLSLPHSLWNMVDSCGYYYSQVENITAECVSALGDQETISSSSICHSTLSGIRKILRVQEILARQCWKRLSEYWQISWSWFIPQRSHGLHQFYDAFSSQYATSLSKNILVLCVILEWLCFQG